MEAIGAAAMTEGATDAASARPRRRPHPAGTARILTAGVSAGAGLGIVTALALTSCVRPAPAADPSTGAGPVVATVGTDATIGATTAPTAPPPAPSPPTSVVRRYILVPVPAGALDRPATNPAIGNPAATSPAVTTPAARQPRPATPVTPPPAAPAPGPAAVTRGSG